MAILILSLFIGGCSPPPANEEVDQTENSSTSDCDDLLDSAFVMLKPERLKISSAPDAAISLLNQWTGSCIDPDEIQLTLKKEQVEGILKGEILERTLNTRFDSFDASHIRDNLLYKQIVDVVSEGETTDIGRVVKLFYYSVRNIALKEVGEPDVPNTAFQTILFGRGNIEDRIWNFCNLVRQLKFDSVVISNPADKTLKNKRYLVGVIISSNVYLFDPLMGTPIPGKDDDPKNDFFVTVPATFAEVVATPGLLTALNINDKEPYPFTAEILKHPFVQVVGDSSFYSDRMKALQFSLGGTRSVIMSDSLVDNDGGDGLLTRVGEAGQEFWKKEDLKNWDFYEKQNMRTQSLNNEQLAILDKFESPFLAPVYYKISEKTPHGKSGSDKTKLPKLQYKKTKDSLKCRVNQITADNLNAIKQYQAIQLAIVRQRQIPGAKIEPQVLFINNMAVQNGILWRGISSYELKDYGTALERFFQYMKITKGKAIDAKHCSLLIAYAFAELKMLDKTSRILVNPPKNSIYYYAASFYYKRWAKDVPVESKKKPDKKSKADSEKGKNEPEKPVTKEESKKEPGKVPAKKDEKVKPSESKKAEKPVKKEKTSEPSEKKKETEPKKVEPKKVEPKKETSKTEKIKENKATKKETE